MVDSRLPVDTDIKVLWPSETFSEPKPVNVSMFSVLGGDSYYIALGFAPPPPVIEAASGVMEIEAKNVQAFTLPRSALEGLYQQISQMLGIDDSGK